MAIKAKAIAFLFHSEVLLRWAVAWALRSVFSTARLKAYRACSHSALGLYKYTGTYCDKEETFLHNIEFLPFDSFPQPVLPDNWLCSIDLTCPEWSSDRSWGPGEASLALDQCWLALAIRKHCTVFLSVGRGSEVVSEQHAAYLSAHSLTEWD